MTRHQQLNTRLEKLIILNQKHHYCISGNPKGAQYTNLLFGIKSEMMKLQREYDKKFDKSNYKFTASYGKN